MTKSINEQRNKLLNELRKLADSELKQSLIEEVADFIIAERKRIELKAMIEAYESHLDNGDVKYRGRSVRIINQYKKQLGEL